jgi:hypothetical protein
MTNASPQPDVILFRPPTPAEVDQLASISAISFIVGALAFICIVGAALTVALKTRLPGRWPVLLSFVLLSAWWALVQFMGGDLEMTFGPVALLVTYTVYSAIAVVFSLGYVRMSFAVFRQGVSRTERSEA